MTQLYPRDIARFRSKTQRGENGCLNWTGKLDNGYGRFWLAGKTTIAHRIAWQIANGPVPDGLQIDHLCRNRNCVEPTHLEPVTLAENVLRGDGISATNARKAKCKRDHPLSGKNLYRPPSNPKRRTCIACMRQRTRDWRAAQAVAA